MEKGCKWYFGNEGGVDIGPNDPIHQTYKGNPYYSIVREAIQNSLDVVNDNSSPVKVTFTYFDLDRINFPGFFQLEEHIKQSSEFYKNNRDAKILFGSMLSYLNGTEKGKKKLKISCLKISDSNTKGMPYLKGDTESPFYAFLRSKGVSIKMIGGAGGSFGFGKGAYFVLSPIKTVIVSSMDANNKVYFEGATWLTTHNNENGAKLTAYGFYDNNIGEPVVTEDNIPEMFVREEVGTNINIIGLWEDVDRDRLMVKSVLNNFWLAIHDKKLIVTINDTVISRENLEQIIDEYFPNEYESGNASEIETWNPKPYYKAVKYTGANDQFKIFAEELEILGRVKLYVYLEKGLPNRTSFFRKPKMVVFKRTNRKINGYAAVFTCDDDNGNEILRQLENPAHNEWRKENHQTEGKIDPIARKAELELSNFINSKLDSLSKISTSKKVAFLGLEDYLSIPEDLLEKDEDMDLRGETENKTGDFSSDITQEETGMQTTDIENPVSIKPKIKTKTDIKGAQDVIPDADGDLEVTHGQGDGDDGTESPTPPGPDDINRGSSTDVPSESKVLKKVRLSVAAQKEDGIIYHYLIIKSDEDITNAEIELLVSSDNDKDDGIALISSDNGNIDKNKILKAMLFSGKNVIKIRFADNLKHTVKIKTYEIQ
jgi:hypothetical protein